MKKLAFLRLPLLGALFRLGFLMGVREGMAPRIGAFIIYASLVIAYASVFRVLPPEDLARLGLTSDQMIWYLALTELTLFSATVSVLFKEVQSDLGSGRYMLHLLRPCPPALFYLFIWLGQGAFRLLWFVPSAFALTLSITGGLPVSGLSLGGVLLSFLLPPFLFACASFVIGASCLWLPQAEPTYWVFQKCLFLFGALLCPLSFYPKALQAAVWVTPFPAMLSSAAQWALPEPISLALARFPLQFFWAVLLAFLVARVDRLVVRTLQKRGG